MASSTTLQNLVFVSVLGFAFCFGHVDNSGSCSSPSHHHHDHAHHSKCSYGHHHHHEQPHKHSKWILPEELAEEEDLELHGFDFYHDHGHDHEDISELSNLSVWVYAMGCSLLVSMASLICQIILAPILF